MSDAPLGILITTTGAFLVAVVSAVAAIISARGNRAVREQMVLLVKQTDGIQASLVRVTGEAEHAKGMIEGTRVELARANVEANAKEEMKDAARKRTKEA